MIHRIFIGLAIIAGLFLMWPIWTIFHPEDQGENVMSVDWLPPEATNISYYRSYEFTAYEFTISESGFRDWALSKGYSLSTITDQTKNIRRYLFALHHTEPDRNIDYEDTRLEIRKGLFYETVQRNGGGYLVVYDTESSRVYFKHTPR